MNSTKKITNKTFSITSYNKDEEPINETYQPITLEIIEFIEALST